MNNIEKKQQEQSDIIWKYFQENKWQEARTYVLGLLRENPDSHILLAILSTTFYEEFDYQTALDYAEQALKIAPWCPLVLWDYAGALDMLERNEEALKVYKKLLRKGVQSVAYDDCGEGIRAARRLLNDCRYRIGLIYARTGNINLAKKYIQEHIDHRNSNTPSIYGLKEVKKKLFTITR